MKKKRRQTVSNRRRALLTTRKADLAELKDARFAELSCSISKRLEPLIEQLIKAEVAKAMAKFAARRPQTPKQEDPLGPYQCAPPLS